MNICVPAHAHVGQLTRPPAQLRTTHPYLCFRSVLDHAPLRGQFGRGLWNVPEGALKSQVRPSSPSLSRKAIPPSISSYAGVAGMCEEMQRCSSQRISRRRRKLFHLSDIKLIKNTIYSGFVQRLITVDGAGFTDVVIKFATRGQRWHRFRAQYAGRIMISRVPYSTDSVAVQT